MNLAWILGAMLMVQPAPPPDSLVITKEGQPISIVTREEFSISPSGIPIINTNKFSQLIKELNKQVSTPPKNASLNKYGNIIPEKAGYRINQQAFTERFYDYYLGHRMDTLELPMIQVYPKVDSELLANIRGLRIGRYITSFNPSNTKRSINIQLAVSAINNHVVFPGETFSFNQVVGKRTVRKGYLKAKVIVRGEYAEDIGGGICQVSSTLFNAVDSAGLQTVQRFSHSRHVPYIPPGRDATVSWYGPDFEFKNNYNQPILIQAKTLGNLLIIMLYSSDVIDYSPRKVPFPPL
ncbi:VanW family protein [Neobacillus sp. FSL H8-0543]|uniref:VanW family protein n=1 Tax=Neobacillus sp. FSL H8-0543 TaxID=2954672 RepID=UPI003158E01D